jgi:hypothetical protein
MRLRETSFCATVDTAPRGAEGPPPGKITKYTLVMAVGLTVIGFGHLVACLNVRLEQVCLLAIRAANRSVSDIIKLP